MPESCPGRAGPLPGERFTLGYGCPTPAAPRGKVIPEPATVESQGAWQPRPGVMWRATGVSGGRSVSQGRLCAEGPGLEPRAYGISR
eukprot:539215-Rhodomonas_salina.2